MTWNENQQVLFPASKLRNKVFCAWNQQSEHETLKGLSHLELRAEVGVFAPLCTSDRWFWVHSALISVDRWAPHYWCLLMSTEFWRHLKFGCMSWSSNGQVWLSGPNKVWKPPEIQMWIPDSLLLHPYNIYIYEEEKKPWVMANACNLHLTLRMELAW